MAALSKIPFAVYFVFIWGVSILLVNPLGEFPLNDDWAFAKSVWVLCETGKMTINDWPAMTLVGQVAWGALFAKIFGLSHVVLRVSTLIASLIGASTFYKLALYFSINRKIAAFASLLLFFNPLYFSLSFTFMTDVHFMAGMLLSIYFFLLYHKDARFKYLLLGALFSVFTTMIRQPGILVPLAFALTAYAKRQTSAAKILHFIPLLVTGLALVLHSFWLKSMAGDTASVGQIADLWTFIEKQNLWHWKTRISQSLFYAGLFLLPLSLLLWSEIREMMKKKSSWIIIAACVAVVGFALVKSSYPHGNILYNLGLGPKVLKDTYGFNNLRPHFEGEIWPILLRILSATGLLFLLIHLCWRAVVMKFSMLAPPGYMRVAKINLLIFTLLYLLFLVIVAGYFDRYTIPLVVSIGLVVIPSKVKISVPAFRIACLCLALVAFFSIRFTHDYLSWNRARWNALNDLMTNHGVSALDIDGGFEFNSWLKTRKSIYGKPGTSWWFVNNDDYVLAFGNLDGFSKFKGYYYPQLLSFERDSIYVLKKDNID